MKPNYDILADYLSDHLWQRNTLDYDFLKSFPEFIYKGLAYRVHFLKEYTEPQNCETKSFAKSKNGIKIFLHNTLIYDTKFFDENTPYVFECEVEGFDIHAALMYFKKHGGLTSQTINEFIDEEEVIAFSHSPLIKIDF